MSSMRWCHISITVLVLTTVHLANSYGTIYVNCADDSNCGPNEFCYVSGLCVPCLDCAMYHRHNSSFVDCIKDAKQCGACFEGWKDDIFTNGDRRDSCVSTSSSFMVFRQNPPEHYTADPVIRFAQLGEFLIIAVTASVFLIGGLLWCRTNWTKPTRILPTNNLLPTDQTRCHQSTRFWDLSESQLTQTSRTSAGSSADGQPEMIHTTIFTAEGSKDAPQLAIPFLRPRYELDDASEEEEGEEVQEVQSPQSPDMSFLHDQDTMPSTWTPNPNESNSSNDTNSLDQEASSSNAENSNTSEAPQAKRIRISNSESDSGIDVFNTVSNQESLTTEETGINLYITNNVVIRKS